MVEPRGPACIRAGTECVRADSGGRTDAAPAARSYRRGDIDGRRIPMSRRRSIRWSRLAAVAVAAAAVCVGAGPPAGAAPPSTVCVGGTPGCFATIQAAVDAAHDGDAIQVAAGTYAGGITIDKSLELDGAGAGATVISGGGPVVKIGSFEGQNEFTVAIDGVTITGGLNDSQPSTSVVAGGGVSIPQSAGDAPGATVTISHSVVTGNRVTASTTIPQGGFSCKFGPHACAFVGGGGIDNSGFLTLDDTDVTNNTAGSTPASPALESNAGGGGIANHPQGTLVLRHCSVTGNRAAVSPPNGSFTDGGGIADNGGMTIEDCSVDGNTSAVVATVPNTFPFGDGEEANAGGIQIAPGGVVTIGHSTVDGNTASTFNDGGDADTSTGGIHNHGWLELDHVDVSGNTVSASVAPGSGFTAGAQGGGLQLGSDPSTTTLRHSRVTGNSVSADSAGGTVFVAGAGLANINGVLTLDHTNVTGNSGAANGSSGFQLPIGELAAVGGGIDNIGLGGAPVVSLSHTSVGGNTLSSTAAAPRGGGIFTRDVLSQAGDPFEVTLDHTAVTGNSPDDCDGC
jgi:hypothetical protein